MSNTIGVLPHRASYKYPFLLLGLYLTFLLATVCLASKLTLIGELLVPGGIFVFGFTFSICEIAGEVYGYSYPRLFIWTGVIAETIFALIVTAVSHLSSPEYFNHPEAYQIVFDPTTRYVISGLIGLMVGEFVNVYLLAKWKISCQGKFFIGRSIVSAGLGQALLTIIVDILNYVGKMSYSDLAWMMICGYLWKMCAALILVFPAWLLVKYLKKVERVDYYDINTNFNPFILSLEGEKRQPLYEQCSFSKMK
ncbi:MAG: queuosine precursor transporter [Gammaproteobacteria bacterium]|nr:queuosine precursor transporter [Gammaproteobacteria bacterium]